MANLSSVRSTDHDQPTTNTASHGLASKINRAFLLQGLLITVAAVMGVFFAQLVIEQILIKNAILEEETHFWERYGADSSFPLPDTKNLTGYFDPEQLPDDIQSKLPQKTGFYEFGQGNEGIVLYLSDRLDKRLYLVYYRGQVDYLVLYYGIFPLFVVLLILYLSLWITYRFSRRTLSPVIRLARDIDQLNFRQSDSVHIDLPSPAFEADSEIQTLSNAIHDLGERLNRHISRERDFTRDASHELRSPITVISIAADLLESEQVLSPPAQKSVLRIKRAVADMEQLTDIFLLLAREDDEALPRDKVIINDIVREEIEQAEILKRGKNIALSFDPVNRLELEASDKVLSVLIGNLLRNAIHYTEQGTVVVRVDGHNVIIEDSGQGMSEQQVSAMYQPFKRGDNVNAAGYGIGLTIVKRLSDRFHWPIDVHSQPGQGTRFRVSFPESRIL